VRRYFSCRFDEKAGPNAGVTQAAALLTTRRPVIHRQHVTSFGICYEKSDDLGRFGNRFNKMSAIPA
jgi:hypothetical protein